MPKKRTDTETSGQESLTGITDAPVGTLAGIDEAEIDSDEAEFAPATPSESEVIKPAPDEPEPPASASTGQGGMDLAAMVKQLVAQQTTMLAEIQRLKGTAPGNGQGVRDPDGVPTAAEAASYLMSYRQVDESTESVFYARMKPFNQEKGRMALDRTFGSIRTSRGQSVRLKGGTNLPGDLTQWVPVDKAAALLLLKEKQHAERAWRQTSQACEATTARGKKLIDAYENQARNVTRDDLDAVYCVEAAMKEAYSGDSEIPPEEMSAPLPEATRNSDTGGSGDMSVRDLTGWKKNESEALAKVHEVSREQKLAARRMMADLPGLGDASGGRSVAPIDSEAGLGRLAKA